MSITFKALFLLTENLVQQLHLRPAFPNRRCFIPLFSAGLLITLSAALLAGQSYSAEKNIDVVLLMDSSGSMKRTDPKTMRKPAARMFISLLGDKDRASIVAFGAEARRLTPLTYAQKEKEKNILLEAIDSVSSDEAYTNLYAAVAEGLKILSKSREDKTTARFIIIMSDGKMDVGDDSEDLSLVKRLETEMVDRLKENRIRLFSLAFTDQSDRKLLETLSKKTGGRFSYTSTDKDFHLIFASIFEDLKEPDMLPLRDNRFNIDTTIDEVTIIATKDSPDTKIMIRSPSGIKYFSDYDDDYIKWFTSGNFDMVTIKAPDRGTWKILFSSGRNNKAYIVTDLKLVSDFNKISIMPGETFSIRIWLESEGKPVEKGSILYDVKTGIELHEPDGSIRNISLVSGPDKNNLPYGFKSEDIKPDQPGNYKINVVVKSNTFERQKKFSFTVVDKKEDKIEFKPVIDSIERPVKKVVKEQKTVKKRETGKTSLLKTFIVFLLINFILLVMSAAYYLLAKKRISAKPSVKTPPEEKKRKPAMNIIKGLFKKKADNK